MVDVSIVIPAYNAEKWLCACLDSVSACADASAAVCEVIVVDDGSTDSTAAVASSYPAVRLQSQPNCGLSAARNAGVDAAEGEWILFVDADDCLLPGAVDALMSAVTSAGCLIGAGRVLKGETCPSVGATGRSFRREVLSAPSAIEQTLYQSAPMLGCAWGKLWHKKLFADNRFTEGLYFEDLDFFYRAFLEAGAVAVTDAPVYFYRQHPDSFLRIFNPHTADVLEVTARLEAFMAGRYPELLKSARDRRLSACFNIFNRIELECDGGHSAVSDLCWREIRRLRLASLVNPRVRPRNKAGVLASFAGRRLYSLLIRTLNKKWIQ